MKTRIAIASMTVLLGLGALARSIPAQENEPEVDKFAQIAAIKADYDRRDLISISPAPLARRDLSIGTPAEGAFEPLPKMTTPEQLREELMRQRELHAPYLQDLAPPLDDLRIRVPLESFD